MPRLNNSEVDYDIGEFLEFIHDMECFTPSPISSRFYLVYRLENSPIDFIISVEHSSYGKIRGLHVAWKRFKISELGSKTYETISFENVINSLNPNQGGNLLFYLDFFMNIDLLKK